MMSFSSVCAGTVIRATKRGYARPLLIVCLLLVGLPFFASAQTATIVGTITDPSGSVVPNVAISATHIETGRVIGAKASDAGQYILADLPIGHYNLKAEASGFSVAQKSGVVLNVGDRTRIDFEMKVGATTENITVEANAVRVQSESGEVSDVITGQQVTQLATNGRSMYTLSALTPGASSLQGDFQTPTSAGGDANVSFNGLREGHNIYLIDGGEDDDRGGGGGSSVMPSIDAIAEFRALTSNYSAEYGLSSAATITSVVRSGGSHFHAGAWWFGRNDALDARNYFNRPPAPVAELRFNTYGFNAGGQLPLWKSHPTFYFYNMEWRSLIQGQTLNQTVPLASTYGGDFSASTVTPHTPCAGQLSANLAAQFATAGQTLSTCDATGKVTTAVPFTGNAIPASLLDANAQALLNAGIFPKPTNGAQFQGGNNSPTNVREEIARIDHQFTDKFSIFGHWISEQVAQGYGTTQWSGDNLPTVGDTFGNPSYSAVIHTTHSISPTLLNEASFNYNGNRINIIPNGLVTAPSDFNFNRVFTGPNALSRIPTINLSQATGSQYSANWTPWVNVADDYQVRDDISWTRGSHQFKFGGSWALYKKTQDLFAATQGNFGFNGFYTGNDFADFLLGYANSYSEDAVKDNGQWNNVSWAAYAQDNWRVNNRLTLNLGLRWDGVPHTYEANHRTSNFYPNLYDPALAATFNPDGTISGPAAALGTSPNPILQGVQFYLNGIGIDGKNGIPKGLVDNHWAAFGPRIGFAYDLTGSGKTVVRGGFGTMYERIQGNDMYNAGTNVPFSASAGFSNVLLSNPKTNIQSGTTLAVPVVASSLTGIARNNYDLPVSYQYSIGVQRALGGSNILSVSYVGNQNRHQNDWREIDLPALSALPGLVANGGAGYNQAVLYPGFRSLRLAQNEANSHYNSLQVELHARMRHDLTLQTAYTYARAIDPTVGGGNSFDLDNVSNPYVGWKFDNGPSIFDRTHVAFVNFIYDLPIFRNSQNGFMKSTLGGWQVSGIVTMESGAPINVTYNGNSVTSIIPNLSGGNSGVRPNLSGPITYTKHYVQQSDGTFAYQWFDPSSFSAPAPGTWGDLGHDALRGPGRDNWNLALFKSFVFNEDRGTRLELRAESFNTWNHTQFKGDVQNGGISTQLGSGNFGIVTNAYDPRVFQLGIKLFY